MGSQYGGSVGSSRTSRHSQTPSNARTTASEAEHDLWEVDRQEHDELATNYAGSVKSPADRENPATRSERSSVVPALSSHHSNAPSIAHTIASDSEAEAKYKRALQRQKDREELDIQHDSLSVAPSASSRHSNTSKTPSQQRQSIPSKVQHILQQVSLLPNHVPFETPTTLNPDYLKCSLKMFPADLGLWHLRACQLWGRQWYCKTKVKM